MKRIARAACAVVLLSLSTGCADKPEVLRVEGNVVSVTGAPAPSAGRTERRSVFALARRVSDLWAAPAIAQSSCGAPVEGVLACLATEGPPGTFAATCARVRSNCEFVVSIELDQPGDTLNLFFCADADGDGQCAPTETSAPYVNFDKVGNFCNGDVLRVSNIAIDFASQTCTGSLTNVVADGCAPPDPTAPVEATPTRRPGEPPPTSGPTLPPGVTPSATVPPPPTATSVPGQPTVTPVPTKPPPQCVPNGGDCNVTGNCCANQLCVDGVCEACAQEGNNCGDPPLCCSATNSCQAGVCQPCGGTGDGCADDGDCCGPAAFCDAGTCAPCSTVGESGCGATPCCSGQGVCFSDTCQFCSLPGDACAVSADCCAFGAGEDCNSGICSACADVGAPCGVDDDCCERPDSDLVCDPVSEDCQPSV